MSFLANVVWIAGVTTIAGFVLQRIYIRLAFTLGFVSVPDVRRRHDRVTAMLGGLGVFTAWIFGMCLIALTQPGWWTSFASSLIPVTLASAAMLLLGLADDLKRLDHRVKLVGQAVIVYSVLFFDPTLFQAMEALQSQFSPIVWFLIPLAIAGFTNAFNMTDGLNGLAGGNALITCVALFVLNRISQGDSFVSGHLVILAAAIIPFLAFNRTPAKTFLGDNGSLFLGFITGVFLFRSNAESNGVFPLLGALIIGGYPVLDLCLAVWRRLRKGQSIFHADRIHLHHQLLRLGFTPELACFSLLFLSAELQMIGIVVSRSRSIPLAVDLSVCAFTLILHTAFSFRTLRISRASFLESGRKTFAVTLPSKISNRDQGRLVTIDLEPLMEPGVIEKNMSPTSLLNSLELMLKSTIRKGDLIEFNERSAKILIRSEETLNEDKKHTLRAFDLRIKNFLAVYDLHCSTAGLPVKVKDVGYNEDSQENRGQAA